MGEERKRQKKPKARNYSVCIPSTVAYSNNAKSLDQITRVAYQLATAASIFNVAELIVLDIPEVKEEATDGKKIKFGQEDLGKKTKRPLNESTLLLAILLQYFVTPPYLVKSIFKPEQVKYFKYAKTYPTLTRLPFMQTQYLESDINAKNFREGLAVPEEGSKVKHVPGTKVKKNKLTKQKLNMTKYINVGLSSPVELTDDKVPVNVRVTVDVKNKKIVSPYDAYHSDTIGPKLSVGYSVRVVKQFSSIFTESSFENGYSTAVYVSSGEYFNNKTDKTRRLDKLDKVEGSNLLVLVGKKEDFVRSFKQDEAANKVDDINEFFNGQLEIPVLTRVEDGVLIGLTKLESM